MGCFSGKLAYATPQVNSRTSLVRNEPVRLNQYTWGHAQKCTVSITVHCLLREGRRCSLSL